MSDYKRVIPRDLFNEGNLLKNVGRLSILLGETDGHNARFEEDEVESFRIEQDPSSGNIRIANLTFTISGLPYTLERSLNSRENWPLWLDASGRDPDFEAIAVFTDDGDLSPEMLALIRADA